MLERRIIKIDEEKCDGCGICADACHEGAIVITEGKARLVKDSYCDGLGDCLGECPRGAISFETRAAEAYDEAAVKARMAEKKNAGPASGCSCPGSAPRSMTAPQSASSLRNWPVQLKLVPENAPYLRDADIVIAADCAAYAHAGFHGELLRGRVCLIGCPKLDDAALYREKLARIIAQNGTRSIDVVYMEVPCCLGLLNLVRDAAELSGVKVPVRRVRLAIDGTVLESEWV